MHITTRQFAELFNVSTQSINLWEKRGCPKVSHGKWDLKTVLEWWLDNVHRATSDTEEMAQAKLEYWQAKAQGEQVKADLARKKVIPVDEIKKAWAWRIQEVGNGLAGIPMRTAALIYGKSEKEIRSILEAEVWKIRDLFSRIGKFTPAVKRVKKNDLV